MLKKLATSIVASGALLLAAAPSQAAITELINNGGFESGDLSGWDSSNSVSINTSTDGPSSGAYSAFFQNGSPAANDLKQTNLGAGFLTANQEVRVSFDYRGTSSAGGVLNAAIFSMIDGGGVSSTLNLNGGAPLFPNGDPSVWNNYSATVNLGDDVSGGIDFLISAPCGAAAGCVSDYYVDNISVEFGEASAVPVPAAAWLFGSGLLGLVGMSKRKK
jgi:hypothetical protein